MPHIQIEYTDNLHTQVTQRGLVHAVHQAAVDSGIFPVWGIRTLARPITQYCVGNGDAGNGFVHVMVRIAPGRSDELRRRITTELFAALERVMAPLMQQQRLGLQLEVAEFDAGMTTYRNNLASSTDADEPVVEHRP